MLELLKPCQRRVNANAIIAVSCMRNESLRIPYFLEYYRQLGIEHFVVVDNCSDDGSSELLAAQPDVTLYLARGRYSESYYGVDWLNEALRIHCCGRWALTVDADELLVYPDSEKRDLRSLTNYLDSRRANALATFMLDMYSNTPISYANYRPGESFLACCRYFDQSGYSAGTGGVYNGLPIRGGPRKRLFWSGDSGHGNPPFLGKTPLVKWAKGLRYEASTHTIKNLRYCTVTGALLHFKFFSDFAFVAERETERGEHWQDGVQYASYDDAMRSSPLLTAYHTDSISYDGSMQLLRMGLIRADESWLSLRQNGGQQEG